MKKVYAVQDQDSHWYVIPAELKDQFFIDESDGATDDYEYFCAQYDKYRTGGDLNNVQLYADI